MSDMCSTEFSARPTETPGGAARIPTSAAKDSVPCRKDYEYCRIGLGLPVGRDSEWYPAFAVEVSDECPRGVRRPLE